MKMLRALSVGWWLLVGQAAFAQAVQVNHQNRTIDVEVTVAIEVEPELAIVRVGYHNFGLTQEVAYEENARAASKIIDALLAAGLKKESIETEAAHLGRLEGRNEDWTTEERKQRQFEADQTWEIRVAPSDAQKVVDRAVAAGANEVQEVSWVVKDLTELQAKSMSAALDKARGLAEQMARTIGGKIGEALYISNGDRLNIVTRSGVGGGNFTTVEVQATPKANLNLFPQKVRRDETLRVIFALE